MPMALHCLVLDPIVDVLGLVYNAQSVASSYVAFASMLSAEVDPCSTGMDLLLIQALLYLIALPCRLSGRAVVGTRIMMLTGF